MANFRFLANFRFFYSTSVTLCLLSILQLSALFLTINFKSANFDEILSKSYFNHFLNMVVNFQIYSTVEPRLSEPHGRHTIRSDNRGVRIDEETRNSLSMDYRVGDN